MLKPASLNPYNFLKRVDLNPDNFLKRLSNVSGFIYCDIEQWKWKFGFVRIWLEPLPSSL
jgi:hypothetical protein